MLKFIKRFFNRVCHFFRFRWHVEAELWEMLEESQNTSDKLADEIAALRDSLTLQFTEKEKVIFNGQFTIACLVGFCGNQVKISKDLTEMVSNSDFVVNTKKEKDGFILSLDIKPFKVEPELEPEFVDGEFEDFEEDDR